MTQAALQFDAHTLLLGLLGMVAAFSPTGEPGWSSGWTN